MFVCVECLGDLMKGMNECDFSIMAHGIDWTLRFSRLNWLLVLVH